MKDLTRQELSRRELLKIMGATGSAVAVSAFIPDSWLPPRVEIGLLPAHATATEGLFITGLQIVALHAGGSLESPESFPTGIINTSYRGDMGYTDYNRTLTTSGSGVDATYCGSSLPIINHSVSPENELSGMVTFDFSADPNACMPPQVCVRLRKTTNHQVSNQECANLPTNGS